MKKSLLTVALFVFAIGSLACANATGSTNEMKAEALKFNGVSALGMTSTSINLYDDEVRAALQSALAKAGFVNDKGAALSYKATARWSSDLSFATICISSEIISTADVKDRIMPGGCVNISGKDTGIDGAVGVALLPKASEKLAAMLRNQIDGKEQPAPPSNSVPPAPSSVNTSPANKPATNSQK